MLGGVGVGAGEEERVLAVLCPGGEHLLAFDHPLVAVPVGSGPGRRDVGSRVWLGVAQAEADVAPGHPRQDVGLELVGAPLLHRRQHHHGRPPRDGGSVAGPQLAIEKGRLQGGGAGAAGVAGPGGHDPAPGRQGLVEALVETRAGAELLVDHLGGDVLVAERPRVVPERSGRIVELNGTEIHDVSSCLS